MKWIFFAYGLFAIATILRYLPLGRWGLAARLGNAVYGMGFNQIAYYLLLAAGSMIILARGYHQDDRPAHTHTSDRLTRLTR